MSAEKPDGWVACPKTNIPVLYFMGAGYSYEQMKERVIRRLRIDPKANRDEEERFVSEGWRIRPVKLQFLDEPKGDGCPVLISERMPTLEERNESLLWFHADSEEWFPGDYSNYDGKHIIISMRHDWRVERSLRDFTHWMFAPKNPNQIPAAPKGEE